MQRNEVIGQQEVWNLAHGDGSGEPFAPCADVLRPAGLRQTGDGTGFCQLSSGRFTDAQEMGTSGSPLHLSYHQDRQYGQRTQTR